MLSGARLKQKVKGTSVMIGAAADVNRLAILYLLAAEPMDIRDIIGRTRLTPPLVAHHMRVLLTAGWVTKSKFGKRVTYYLVESAAGQLAKFLQKRK